MTVRAKFKVETISRQKHWDKAQGEIQTIKLSPVYGNNDPQHENTKFWAATPSGSVELGTVNGSAAAYFELGEEYYLDFTKA